MKLARHSAGAVTIVGQVAVIAAPVYLPIAVAISSALPVVVTLVSVLLLGSADRVTRRTVAAPSWSSGERWPSC
jgi:hypothetical protein